MAEDLMAALKESFKEARTRREQSMKVIELDEAVATAVLVIREKGPNFVYSQKDSTNPMAPGGSQACQYYACSREPRSGCIVGEMLRKWGLTDEDIHRLPVAGVGEESLRMSLYNMGISFSENTGWFLKRLQTSQDSGVSWGESYRRALEWLRLSYDVNVSGYPVSADALPV